jgi:ADP-heptose:LPS heptosyltransferase
LIEGRLWNESDLEELVRRATDPDAGKALEASRILFRGVVEHVCDLFDPDSTVEYARFFSGVVEHVLPQYSADTLFERYLRIREPRVYNAAEPERVVVLSRVTLGADVAVTSVLLDAAKRRFPRADIYLAGPAKNIALFGADERIKPLVVNYGRGHSLRDRLRSSEALRQLVDDDKTLVLDPDSRLTQLGIIPVCSDPNYLFFESRAYGGASDAPLPALTRAWAEQTLQTEGARAYLCPTAVEADAEITVSLGVGENSEKLAGPELEQEAIGQLASLKRPMLIDCGAGGEESERVLKLIERLGSPVHVRVHKGSFADFASYIMQSRLYFGYDSAGQHVAAAAGVPLVTVFAGYASERTFERWRPAGEGSARVIKAGGQSSAELTKQTLAALISAEEEAGLS